MRRTLFATVAALLLALPAACIHPHHGQRGGPGGPGGHGRGCGCECGQQQERPKPDCCPQRQAPAPPAK